MHDLNFTLMRCELEKKYEWRKWFKEIPFLKLPDGVEFKPVPPIMGAVVRFIARYNNNTISIYFDAYQELGLCSHPYWEIYPDKDGDATRFLLGDEDKMCKAIWDALKDDDEL